MPVSRRSQGAGSLLGHFQPTKKIVGAPHHRDVKGKGKVVPTESGRASPLPTGKEVDASSQDMVMRPEQPLTNRITTAQDLPSPITPTSSSPTSRPSSQTGLLGTPIGSRLSSVSPPPELLHATHKSPVSVREDPDRGKFYLMISSPKKNKRSSSSPSQLQIPKRGPPHLRQGSPSLDRTPVRDTFPELPRQPPQAPKKRQLDDVGMEKLRMQNDESPLPHDKRRPSYRALGASQDAGLTLMSLGDDSEEDYSSPKRHKKRPRYDDRQLLSSSSPMSSDDELIITPRKVREQPPKGIPPMPFATPTKAAKFDDPFTPRIKPMRSAGIFSSLVKPNHVGEPRPATSSDEENPFLDSSPATSSSSTFAAAHSANRHAGIPDLSYSISPNVPLPPHYTSLYLLHTGIEHALVVHLATTGIATSSVDSTFTDSLGENVVRLPNLITYAALRPLVERVAGRRLGPVELARLMYVWSNGRAPSQDSPRSATVAPVAPAGKDQETLSGLGFLLGRRRCLDANGRRGWDWSLGIELTIKRPIREDTPPLQVSFGGSQENGGMTMQIPNTPPSSSSAKGNGAAFGSDTPPSTPRRRTETCGSTSSPAISREGMSLIALWNNGLEERKSEVGRRLRSLCAHDLEQWLQGKAAPVIDMDIDERPSTPEPSSRRAEVGAGGLLTPSATRPEGRRQRYVKVDEQALDADDDDDRKSTLIHPPSPFITNQDDVEWSLPAKGETPHRWHPSYNLKDAKAVPCAILPSLKDGIEAPHLVGGRREAAKVDTSLVQHTLETSLSSTTPSQPTSTPPSRAQSLEERIKAKEALKRSNLQARAGFGTSTSSSSPSSPSNGEVMATFKRRATLSRLNDIATSLHMLFVTSSNNDILSPINSSSIGNSSHSSSSSSSSGNLVFGGGQGVTRRSPILALSTVLSSLSKSSRVTLSITEARGCLDLLSSVCPGFIEVRNIAGKEWVKLGEGSDVGLNEVRRRVKAELDLNRTGATAPAASGGGGGGGG